MAESSTQGSNSSEPGSARQAGAGLQTLSASTDFVINEISALGRRRSMTIQREHVGDTKRKASMLVGMQLQEYQQTNAEKLEGIASESLRRKAGQEPTNASSTSSDTSSRRNSEAGAGRRKSLQVRGEDEIKAISSRKSLELRGELHNATSNGQDDGQTNEKDRNSDSRRSSESLDQQECQSKNTPIEDAKVLVASKDPCPAMTSETLTKSGEPMNSEEDAKVLVASEDPCPAMTSETPTKSGEPTNSEEPMKSEKPLKKLQGPTKSEEPTKLEEAQGSVEPRKVDQPTTQSFHLKTVDNWFGMTPNPLRIPPESPRNPRALGHGKPSPKKKEPIDDSKLGQVEDDRTTDEPDSSWVESPKQGSLCSTTPDTLRNCSAPSGSPRDAHWWETWAKFRAGFQEDGNNLMSAEGLTMNAHCDAISARGRRMADSIRNYKDIDLRNVPHKDPTSPENAAFSFSAVADQMAQRLRYVPKVPSPASSSRESQVDSKAFDSPQESDLPLLRHSTLPKEVVESIREENARLRQQVEALHQKHQEPRSHRLRRRQRDIQQNIEQMYSARSSQEGDGQRKEHICSQSKTEYPCDVRRGAPEIEYIKGIEQLVHHNAELQDELERAHELENFSSKVARALAIAGNPQPQPSKHRKEKDPWEPRWKPTLLEKERLERVILPPAREEVAGDFKQFLADLRTYRYLPPPRRESSDFE